MGIYVALGSNLPSIYGPPRETLEAAILILGHGHIQIERRSRWYFSEAYPDPNDPPFINGVVRLSTNLSPRALLMRLHEIERDFGRRRREKWSPRTLDLDLLDYQGRILGGASGDPKLPHPRLAERAFVLLPLKDVAPHWRHPATAETIESLISRLPQDQTARPLATAP